jgi:hypothetical protein
MANRMIRDSLLSSETLARLTHPAERLFWRLVVLADDFGRFHASPRYVRSAAMGLLKKVSPADIGRWLHELQGVGAICLYTVNDRQYFHFVNWSRHQRLRAKQSKFPIHDESIRCHPRTSADICRSEAEAEAEAETETETQTKTEEEPTAAASRQPRASSKPMEQDDALFEEFWRTYPRRDGDNPKKRAKRAWNARLQGDPKSGIAPATPTEMIEGAKRYAAWIRARGEEGTRFVKQAATFLGPDSAFRETWAFDGVGETGGDAEDELPLFNPNDPDLQ